jgi:SAM-dependent methyltransferase
LADLGPSAGRSIEEFDALYSGTPPWDIGRPQPAFVRAADAGRFRGRFLDVGCGTGEHALLAASLGLEAIGVDAAPTAIALAQAKAADRGLTATFLVADALDLGNLGQSFDTVVDSGLFHVFDDADRARYVASLSTAVAPGGTYLMLCFSERQPGDWGPRRVTEAEIRASFAEGWTVESVEPVTMDVNILPEGVAGWLSSIRRAAGAA